jgi:hypothetical protein
MVCYRDSFTLAYLTLTLMLNKYSKNNYFSITEFQEQNSLLFSGVSIYVRLSYRQIKYDSNVIHMNLNIDKSQYLSLYFEMSP